MAAPGSGIQLPDVSGRTTTSYQVISGVGWDYTGYIAGVWGLYRDNGKQHGNYYFGFGGLGFRGVRVSAPRVRGVGVSGLGFAV